MNPIAGKYEVGIQWLQRIQELVYKTHFLEANLPNQMLKGKPFKRG